MYLYQYENPRGETIESAASDLENGYKATGKEAREASGITDGPVRLPVGIKR